jgi:lipoprotein-anchoring transpeptidase ErfK/SrfK
VTRRYARPLSLLIVALTVAACGPRDAPVTGGSSSGKPGSVAATGPGASASAAVPVVVSASIADGATVTAKQRVRLTASGGVLGTVTLTASDGTVVATATNVSTWTSPADLAPLKSYTLEVATADSAGTPSTFTRTFTTGAPAMELKTNITPYGDQVVGIAMPIVVTLNHPVATKDRAAVESGLTVEADKNFGEGSWAWLSSTELHFRPATFWPAYTHITVHSNLAGVHGGAGIWGATDRDVTFQTGRSMVLRVNDATHKMTVTIDGKLTREVAVSLGKKGFETRSGIKVVSEKFTTYHMQSSTIGVSSKTDPNYYDVTVPLAMRITNSGEFIHGAPWNKLIGKADASHGCTNVSLADATWLFARVIQGDPVITTGTVKPMEGWNGLGAEWNYSYSFWKTLSAQ